MKKVSLGLLSLASVATMAFTGVNAAFAASDTTPQVTSASQGSATIKPNDANPILYWTIIGHGTPHYAQSAWHNGPEGWGPADLQLSQTFTMSNGVSGQVEVSLAQISASVGWNVSYSYGELASYTVHVPSGHDYEIQWGAVYYHVPVIQQEYEQDNPGGTWAIGSPVTCDASRWDHYVYRYVVLH